MDSISKYFYFDDIHEAIRSVERPRNFSFGSTVQSFCLPGLEVPGIGPIGLPLSSQQAEALAKACSQAPFGCKNATISDESVQRCLQLSPHQFRLANESWSSLVQHLADKKVKAGLGLPENYEVTPHLCKLLLYQPGDCFAFHPDSEEEDGVFGTLVFVLPSEHQGGELVIRHSGQETRFDFAKENRYKIHYAAYFAGCENEVLPVRTGYRLALVYNLIAKGSSQTLLPADNLKAVQQIVAALKVWNRDQEGPQKLILPLEHKYSSESLAFDKLCGSDIGTLDVLLETAKLPSATCPPFQFALGMLEKEERFYYTGDEPDKPPVRSSLCLRNVVTSSKAPVRFFESMDVDKEEFVPRDALESHEWDDVERRRRASQSYDWDYDNTKYETTETRWYRHAVIVIWPDTKAWEIAAVNNLDEAVKSAVNLSDGFESLPAVLEAACLAAGRFSPGESATLASLVTVRAREGDMPPALSALVAHCKRLCAERYRTRPSTFAARGIALLIVKHGDVGLARAFLAEGYAGQDCRAYTDGHLAAPEWHVPLDVMAPLGARFGWRTLESEMLKAVRRCADSRGTDSFRVLLELAPPKEKTTQAQPGMSALKGEASKGGNEGGREAVCLEAVRILVEELSSKSYLSGGPERLIGDLSSGMFYLVLDRFGWERFVPLIDSLIDRRQLSCKKAVDHFLKAARLRSDVAQPLTSGFSTALLPRDFLLFTDYLCQKLGKEVTSLLLAEGDAPLRYGFGGPYKYNARNPDTIVDLMKALSSLDFSSEELDQVVAHFFETPNYHDLDTTLLPTTKLLGEWLEDCASATPWFLALVRGCLEALESGCVCPATSIDCTCSYCKQLLDFCLDQGQTEKCFLNVLWSEKAHMKATIQRCEVPVQEAHHEHPAPPGLYQIAVCIEKGDRWEEYLNRRQKLADFKDHMKDKI